MKRFLHITLFVFFFSSAVHAQKKEKKDELSYKDKLKFERLYIDANKAKLLEDYDQSIKLFEACLKIDPNTAAAYYELGNLYMQFNETERAIENSAKAIEIDPDNYYYRLLYAEILKNTQQFEDAEKEYRAILKLFPSKVNIYVEIALLNVFNKEYQKAIEVYDDLEEQIGPNVEIKLKKQYLYIQLGEIEKAADEIQALIDLEPDNVDYYLLLAEVYYVNGVDDKALKTYKKAADLFPENSRVHLSMAEYYRGLGQFEKSLGHLKIAFADPSLDVDSKVKTILGFFDLADREPAYRDDIFDLGQILSKAHPNNARVMTINGDIAMSMNNKKLARKYFMQAVQIEKDRYPIWYQLLELEAELDIFDSLEMHSEEAVELFPNQPVCYYFLGYSRGRLKKYKESAEAYESGLNLIIDNPPLKNQFYLSMADAYNEIGEYAKSDAAFEEALKIDSNNTIVLNNYSYYLSVRGEQLERALKMSAKSNKLSPNQATYLDTYAWIFYKLKRYDEAKTWMEKALNNGGDNSGVILEHMGDILYQLNEEEKAVDYWKKAKEVGETSEFIDKKIGDRKLYE